MSSTNRSAARLEHVADYYVTPVDQIETFLQAFNQVEDIDWNNISITDPCAGGNLQTDDLIAHDMSYPKAINNIFGECDIDTYDIREDSLAEFKTNYLTYNSTKEYDMIITNPPFACALEMIKKALDDVKDGGYVIMLLRLNFLETKARKVFFDEYMPEYIYVHHKRMSFTEHGGTDSCAYAHFVWRKGSNPDFAKLQVI